jgi:hypothetical protein
MYLSRPSPFFSLLVHIVKGRQEKLRKEVVWIILLSGSNLRKMADYCESASWYRVPFWSHLVHEREIMFYKLL